MEKGSGIITPSTYGYNIGDRIKTISGGSSSSPELKCGYTAWKGDEGIITGVEDAHTEILYDNGKFGVRYEYNREQNFVIIKPSNNEPTYEIY
jgi:hypothetical protein